MKTDKIMGIIYLGYLRACAAPLNFINVARTGPMRRCAGLAIAAAPSAATAQPAQPDSNSFAHLTSLIDARIALAVSVASILLLITLWRTDFKNPRSRWGGRLCIFILVFLNIGLWATQL